MRQFLRERGHFVAGKENAIDFGETERKRMNQDLTEGKPSTVLWKFCLPLFVSVVFQQLYNIADSLVAGNMVGENALAAVGNSYEITLIYLAFAFGCNIGCSVIISRLFGARDHGRLKTATSTAFITSAVVCAVLMVVGMLLGRPLLLAINTPEEVLADSLLYLNIYTLGLPFVFFYNIANGVFSALGDSQTPLKFLACSSLSNIAVDVLFVKLFENGVAGVAWATFLCQGVSCVLALLVVLRRLKAMPEKMQGLFSVPLLKDFAVIAIPSTLQQSFVSVGNIIIQGVINSFGTSVMAGYAASIKLNNLVITSFTTLGNGISNYTAQNLGAGKPERIRGGFGAGLKLVWLLCIPLAALYFFVPRPLVGLFMNEPTEASIQTGITILRIFSPFYFVVSAKLVADGILRGAGEMKLFMVATFTDLLLRVVLAVVLSKTALGSLGIWCAWPVGWCIATGLSVLFYKRGPWNRPAAKPAPALSGD